MNARQRAVLDQISRLGDLVELTCAASVQAVQQAAVSRLPEERLGEAMVRLRLLSVEEVDRALKLQARIRQADTVEGALLILEEAQRRVRERTEHMQWLVPPTTVNAFG